MGKKKGAPKATVTDWIVTALIIAAMVVVFILASPAADAQVPVGFDDFPFVIENGCCTAELVVRTHVPVGLPSGVWPGPIIGLAVQGPSLLDPPDVLPGDAPGTIYEPPLGSIVFGSGPVEPGSVGLLMLSVWLTPVPSPYPVQPWTPAYTALGVPGSWFWTVWADANGQFVGATQAMPPGGWVPFELNAQFAWLLEDGGLLFTQVMNVELPP